MNFVGKTCRVSGVKVNALGCLFSLCSILAASAALAQTAAPAMEIAGGDARYCEIFLITGEPGKLEADVYNTLTLNDCPADKWKALNPEALKEEFKVSAVFKNGPRFWVVHKTFVLKTGKMYTDKRDFGGIEAFYAGTVKLPPDFGKGLVAYQEGSIARDTRYMFSKGKPVFLLIDPNGGTWVMQAYSHIVDNSLTLESLSTLDRKLKLPQGWQYRVKTLDRDLTVQPVNGVARIVQDDLQSTYNLCFETACSYDPK